VDVTFAGSPDRVEARLVPEAGYELDLFRVSGLPRRPSLAQLRAVMLAAGAPRACRRILRRRRPDVVLGGGGFVAGPMVFAASTMRIPTALTEADAHFGLANRIAAPFARRIFLSYPLETRHRSKVRVVGRPIPERSKAVPQAEARALFELPHEGPVLGVFGALAGAKALNEFVVDTWGASGPPILHVTGRRDFDLVRRRVQRDDYRVVPETLEASLMLVVQVLLLLKLPASKVMRTVAEIRADRYATLRSVFRHEGGRVVDETHSFREELRSILLPPGAWAVGRSIEEVRGQGADVSFAAVRRHGITGRQPEPGTVLREGDIVVIDGTPEALEHAEAVLLGG